jgi:hypothetical protein
MKNTSTSSSDSEALRNVSAEPAQADARWIASIAAALACALLVLGVYEWTLRASGAAPNFRDNQARWSLVREAAARDVNHDAIAILGASRVRAAISLSELEVRYPDQGIYPLGYIGRVPCAALKDIADTTEFRGTVIVSVTSVWIECRPGPYQMHNTVSRYHSEWNWARKLDAWAMNLVTQSLVAADPDHSIRTLITNAVDPDQTLLQKRYEITRRNRQLEIDFSQFTDEQLAHERTRRAFGFSQFTAPDEASRRMRWQAGLQAFDEAITKITERGGQVILVRLPTGGALRQTEEEFFPRAEYWDEMERQLPAAITLHYQDDPTLADIEVPDGDHLDFRDAPAFTAALFDALEQKGVDFSRE